MASYCLEIFLSAVWFLALWAWRKNLRKLSYQNLPIIGMLPTLLLSVEKVHDVITEILKKSRRGTFRFKGPWFSNMEILCTVNPADVHYIMSSNFENFPKGPQFREIFDVLGRGIFNSDSDSWRCQRKAARALINHRGFVERLARINREKMEGGVVPIFDLMCETNRVFDLQDIFQRLTFDTTCALVTGYDPGCLSIDLRDVPFSRAMDDAEEAIFTRHVLPERVWKFKRWVQVGSERKLRNARRVLDDIICGYIARKRDELRKKRGNLPRENNEKLDEEGGADLLSSYIRGGSDDDEFLRDTVLNLMIAGRDTTSSALTWLMWLVSTHPEVERKILEELGSVCGSRDGNEEYPRVFRVDETSRLVYMHGAICEALRLYPPVPFQHKVPMELDIIPSGHYVHPKMKVMFFLYAMGRMESIWGKECLKFKPERWITERGTIKHEPSYKFLAFNAGPRTCLGKEVAFTQIKSVAATIIYNYRVLVAEGHRVVPNCSVILYMREGLKVRVTKRLG